jgi:hypothetical protein
LALAHKAMRPAKIFDAPCQFEFEQRHPHRAPRICRRARFVERDRRRAEQGDDPLASGLGLHRQAFRGSLTAVAE